MAWLGAQNGQAKWVTFWGAFSNGKASLVAQRLKHLPGMLEARVRSLGREDPLEYGMASHSSILWTEEPGGL